MQYSALVYSKLQNGILVWSTTALKYLNEIQANMNNIVRVITNSSRYSPLSPLYKKFNFLKLTEIYELELAKFMHQLQNNKFLKLFHDLFCKTNSVHGHNTTRASKDIYFRARVKKCNSRLVHGKCPLWWDATARIAFPMGPMGQKLMNIKLKICWISTVTRNMSARIIRNCELFWTLKLINSINFAVFLTLFVRVVLSSTRKI